MQWEKAMYTTKRVSLLTVITLLYAACSAASTSGPSVLTLAAAPQDPAFARVPGRLNGTRVYTHSFDDPPGAEWSFNKVSKTEVGNRAYLGGIPSLKPVTLSLKDLPQHDLVRITFDLYLFEGWSGSSPYWGYARWDLNLGDGRNLLHTSFSNCGEGPRIDADQTNNEQAFPDSFDIRIHPSFTGATEKSTLLRQRYSGVYHFDLLFPHADKEILFAFRSVIQEGTNRTWGIANVTVETLPALPPHSESELEQLWKDLGSTDPMKAYAALWELAASGDQSVQYIAKHLGENIDMTVDAVTDLVKDLESADKETAGALIEKIARQGNTALRPLRVAYNREDITPIYKDYLRAAIYIAKRYNATATELRLARTAQLLKIIHTKTALNLLVTLPEPRPRNVDAPNPVPPSDDKPRPIPPEPEAPAN
jgi:hypothetical protein